ncbi:hypothetical protein M8C21_001592, partial [Ambrosia artemisiifolia]
IFFFWLIKTTIDWTGHKGTSFESNKTTMDWTKDKGTECKRNCYKVWNSLSLKRKANTNSGC